MSTCPDCGGSGNRGPAPGGSGVIRCWTCNGTGRDTAEDFFSFKERERERAEKAREEAKARDGSPSQ